MMAAPILAFGHSYLFWEGRGRRGYETYIGHLRRGIRGLCISDVDAARAGRPHPSASAVVWLVAGPAGQVVQTIPPRKPHKILQTVRAFLKTEHGGVVFIDGLASLLRYNDFRTILQVFQKISDEVALCGGILIMTIDPTQLQQREVSLLEREFETLDEDLLVLSLMEAA